MPLYDCLFAPQAQADIDEIWDYTYEHWGLKQADFYTNKIREISSLLEDNPRLGLLRDDVNRAYRSLQIKNHSIFYRIDNDRVIITRILHQNMDVLNQLN